MRIGPLVISAVALAAPAGALDLRLSGFYDLNRPASLDYDPDFCGLWIVNEGPEVVLVTLDGHELRRFSTGLARVKALTIDGVVPSEETVASQDYPIARTLHFFTNGEPEGLAKRYVDYVLSDEVQNGVVVDAGFVPVSSRTAK